MEPITATLAALGSLIAEGAAAVGSAVTGVAGAVGEGIAGAAGAVGEGIAGAAGAVGEGIAGAAGAAGEGIAGAAGAAGEGIAGAAGTVGEGVASAGKEVGSTLSKLSSMGADVPRSGVTTPLQPQEGKSLTNINAASNQLGHTFEPPRAENASDVWSTESTAEIPGIEKKSFWDEAAEGINQFGSDVWDGATGKKITVRDDNGDIEWGRTLSRGAGLAGKAALMRSQKGRKYAALANYLNQF